MEKRECRDIDGKGILHKEGCSAIDIKAFHLQLVSSDQVDPETGYGKCLPWNRSDGPVADDTHYTLKFKWNASLGLPGAFLIKNMHGPKFFLESLTLSIPREGDVRFHCNSWIWPCREDQKGRVFFSNKSFLPDQTPAGLKKLRELDLEEIRGDGKGERKESDRIYDYDVYNDLGDPDKKEELTRKVLGGSKDFPYPRRCRTGRLPTKKAREFESRVGFLNVNFIPPDERFPHSDSSGFKSRAVTSLIKQNVKLMGNWWRKHFCSFSKIMKLYYGRETEGHHNPFIDKLTKFPLPQIVNGDEYAWRQDEEFARQTLAGVNPLVIQRLKNFPLFSSLDENMYGPQQSAITEKHIKENLEGLSVDQAISYKRLFVIDYYDAYMPYVERINKLPDDRKMYASRMLFFLTSDKTLIPLAIELCLPPTDGKEAVRKVFTPAKGETEEGAVWLLAKAHARVNDAGFHQLVSHWLRTHCITEPIIIATHRQLSTMHPLFKLLVPHYLNTMEINQYARRDLINAGGIIEKGFTSGKYSMEISSEAYKDWKFNEQGLPADLLKRGMAVLKRKASRRLRPEMAVLDLKAPDDLTLVIKDYPYAVDGLEIWFALKEWVSDYLSLYYEEESVTKDKELQDWWAEIVNVGHGDLNDDLSRWYKINSLVELVEAVTTIIWTTSAHHAAVNFGQYAYGGYMPNMPTMSRCFIPEKGTAEYKELVKKPESYFLKTVSNPKQSCRVMAVLKLLSEHAKNEVYLGQLQGSTMDLTDNSRVEAVFRKFQAKMKKVEKDILDRNNKCEVYKNRNGPAEVPYTLLYPDTTNLTKSGGLTGRGVPNSVSI